MSESHRKEPKGADSSRRQAFVQLGLGSICVACAGASVFGYEFLAPNVLYEPSPITNAGKPDRYPLGSVTQDLQAGIYIVHGPEGLYAMSAVCTHLGCLTAWKPETGKIECPCHGSKFAVFQPAGKTPGEKVDGPAPKPLPWLKMWLSDDGELIVDRSEEIRPETFVRV